ncbi:MAG: transcription elongation factor GreA [Gammaproteobacteria bacterium]
MTTPLTAKGAQRLREELYQLEHTQRASATEAVVSARAHGDMGENPEYNAAKEQQTLVENRIAHLKARLAKARIIDTALLHNDGHVRFGSIATVCDLDSGETFTYQLVGEDESDITAGRISVEAPLARGMLGKAEADLAVVDTPGGTKHYEILSVRSE